MDVHEALQLTPTLGSPIMLSPAMESNEAAWLTVRSEPLEVRAAPFTEPHAHELVIRNGAIAVSTIECAKQILGDYIFDWMAYPAILGNDCAGTVIRVGRGVTRFKIGDRVLAHAIGMDPIINNPSEGAFQKFTVVRDTMTSRIPDWMTFEEASVVPLSISTAACALFQKKYLNLNKPCAARMKSLVSPTLPRLVLLVWGASSSVGGNVIQLGKAGGYEVIGVCSVRNFQYIHALGAEQAFDYGSKTVKEDIIEALGDKYVVGAVAIGPGSTAACVEILSRTRGRKMVAQLGLDIPKSQAPSSFQTLRSAVNNWWSDLTVFFKSQMSHVRVKMVYGNGVVRDEIGAMIYNDFLPGALESGKYVPAPQPQVVGTGLQFIQTAMNLQMQKGTPAGKYVVSL